MKIITWNDCCKFREKFSLLVPFDADIMVIEECEDPQRASSDSYSAFESNALGIGHNKNKGVGVFAKPRIKIEKLAWDRLHDQRNQTTVTRLLQERGLVSAYHYVTSEAPRQESRQLSICIGTGRSPIILIIAFAQKLVLNKWLYWIRISFWRIQTMSR